MSTTLEAPPATVAPTAAPARFRFDVATYEAMVERGILTEQHRVELIRGELYDKMTIGDRHAACVNRLVRQLVPIAGERAIVSVQNPLRLASSVPEPDLALLRPRDDYYASGKPQASDVLLVIEVADTSLTFDREVKASVYAEAGIPELWLVNLIANQVEVHRDPRPDGRYAAIQVLARGDQIRIAALGEAVLPVDAIL